MSKEDLELHRESVQMIRSLIKELEQEKRRSHDLRVTADKLAEVLCRVHSLSLLGTNKTSIEVSQLCSQNLAEYREKFPYEKKEKND